MTTPLILVTNDDGVHAPGIRALAAALRPLGEVHVVAPDREVSACAQSLTLKHPLRAERIEPNVHSVDGTPADCVNLAIVKLLPRRPELVVSGINRGANLGDDVFYSGTVGGAREGTFFGVHSLAISLAARSETDFGPAARFAHTLAARVLEKGLPERTLLNVNVPAITSTELEGIEVTRMGKRIYQDELIRRLDPRGVPYFWFGGPAPSGHAEPGTDFHAVVNRRVAITPIQLDLTAQRLLERIRAWEWELASEPSIPNP